MNVLTTTWRQLVRLRLWPLAVLLVAALAAVPFLLSREAEPIVETPVAPATAESAKVSGTLAEPVVAAATTEDRSRRRRVLGSRKDPFEPAPVKKPKKAKKTAETKQQSDTPESPAPRRASATACRGRSWSRPRPSSPRRSTRRAR